MLNITPVALCVAPSKLLPEVWKWWIKLFSASECAEARCPPKLFDSSFLHLWTPSCPISSGSSVLQMHPTRQDTQWLLHIFSCWDDVKESDNHFKFWTIQEPCPKKSSKTDLLNCEPEPNMGVSYSVLCTFCTLHIKMLKSLLLPL